MLYRQNLFIIQVEPSLLTRNFRPNWLSRIRRLYIDSLFVRAERDHNFDALLALPGLKELVIAQAQFGRPGMEYFETKKIPVPCTGIEPSIRYQLLLTYELSVDERNDRTFEVVHIPDFETWAFKLPSITIQNPMKVMTRWDERVESRSASQLGSTSS